MSWNCKEEKKQAVTSRNGVVWYHRNCGHPRVFMSTISTSKHMTMSQPIFTHHQFLWYHHNSSSYQWQVVSWDRATANGFWWATWTQKWLALKATHLHMAKATSKWYIASPVWQTREFREAELLHDALPNGSEVCLVEFNDVVLNGFAVCVASWILCCRHLWNLQTFMKFLKFVSDPINVVEKGKWTVKQNINLKWSNALK